MSAAECPETIARHEWIGRTVEIRDAADPTLEGRGGRIVSETMRTFVIERGGERWRVAKRAGTFATTIEDASRDGATTTVAVAGDRLVGRPAMRTEMTGESPWR